MKLKPRLPGQAGAATGEPITARPHDARARSTQKTAEPAVRAGAASADLSKDVREAPRASTKLGVPGPTFHASFAVDGTMRAAEILSLPLRPLTPAPEVDRLPEPEGVLQGWWNAAVDLAHGRYSSRELSRARKTVEAVRALEPTFAAKSDEELRGMTAELSAVVHTDTAEERKVLESAERALAEAAPLDQIERRVAVEAARARLYKAERKVLERLMPEAFATVREAARRATGMFPFEVQVMGGALMARSQIAEMYTGEGKTLAAVMPAYLAALAGHGFHIATVNDYLARRDGAEMGAIFGALGLSVGVLQANGRQLVRDAGGEATPLREATRKEAYQADITYGTATELGFDYLRDNGAFEPTDRVQRPLYGVLIDEVDAILVDEARVPLIIAEPGPAPEIEELERYRDLVAELDWKTDVEWNQEERWVALTESGAERISKRLGVETIYDSDHLANIAGIQEALQARFLFRRDEDYAVIDGRVLTIGKNGHAEEGRRFAQGLHQALEAKEHLEVLPDTSQRASVTMRDFLGLYATASGMTGTGLSGARIFSDVYGLDVVRVPARKKLIRIDFPDRVFLTAAEKKAAFLDHVAEVHASGRPILIGVEWTKTAEELAKALEEKGIPVRLLTAKNDAEEADVIANAGRLGAVTVVTPRGGRGVDIKLGGSDKLRVRQVMEERQLPRSQAVAWAAAEVAKERAAVLGRGGLFVMGYEHCDSRRRDDQLRGRAGRQGDPGSTIFYTSIDDPLYDGLAEAERLRERDPEVVMQAGLTPRALDHSERMINDELTSSTPYDQVFSTQRKAFYGLRNDVLEATDARALARGVIDQAIGDVFDVTRAAMPTVGPVTLSALEAKDLYRMLASLLPLPEHGPPPDWTEKNLTEIRSDIDALKDALLARRDEAVGPALAAVLERRAILDACDKAWMQHLDTLTSLRQGIHLRGYGAKDPRVEFQAEAGNLYSELLGATRARVARALLKTTPFVPRPSDGAAPKDG